MKMLSFKLFGLSLLSFLWLGCSEELEVPPEAPAAAYTYIDEDLIPFLENFVIEANARGVELDIDSLEMRMVDRLDNQNPNHCGRGWFIYEETGFPRVEILNSFECWINRSLLEKEQIVFHELGHALLNRDDINKQFDNGTPATIMCGLYCLSYQVYFDVPGMREYFMDELFDENVPEPEWANNDNRLQTVLSGEDYDSDELGWQWGLISDVENLSGYEFFIEPPGIFPTSSIGLAVHNVPQSNSLFEAGILFDVPDFEGCTTLKVTADAKTQGTMRRVFLRLYVNTGEPDYNFVISNWGTHAWLEEGVDHRLEAKILCLPQNVRAGSVHIRMEPNIPSTIYVDNIQVELLD